MISTLGLAVLIAIALVRGKPEGVRLLALSIVAAFAGVLLLVFAIAATS